MTRPSDFGPWTSHLKIHNSNFRGYSALGGELKKPETRANMQHTVRSEVRRPKADVRGLSYFRLPLSSAMYIISCLKMNRFGASSRVKRTMFLS